MSGGAVSVPSLPKPRQTVRGGVRETGHLRRCGGDARALWLSSESLLHGCYTGNLGDAGECLIVIS